MTTSRRLLAGAIFILLSGGSLFAGTDYYGVVIRSLEPMDFLVLKKVKVNDKDEFRQLSRSAPLTEKQYKKLPKLSFGSVRRFQVEDGQLRVQGHNKTEWLALPREFKAWPRGTLAPAEVTHGSTLEGELVNRKQKFSARLQDGWTVYLFTANPGGDTVSFVVAEALDTEEGWKDFLERFPGSLHAQKAREILVSAYVERARQALQGYQTALHEKTSGYQLLGEARRWIEEAKTLDVQTEAAARLDETIRALELDLSDRLREARLLAEGNDFAGARQALEPLAHFREEFPALATELQVIQQLQAGYHIKQARQLLQQNQFDQAERQLDEAERYQSQPEIAKLREEVMAQRLAFARHMEIQQALEQAKEAEDRNDLARAFEVLWPLATKYPEETELQDRFFSVRRLYGAALLEEVAEVEKLVTPIGGPADEAIVLRLYRNLDRLSQSEPTPSLAVWRDRLSRHLGDYAQQRFQDLVTRRGESSALAYAYLEQAYHFLLDKSELTEIVDWRQRVGGELGMSVGLAVRDVSPQAGAQALASEIAIAVSSAIQEAGFPHVRVLDTLRATSAKPNLELLVEVTHAAVQDSIQSELVPSTHSAGLRQVPNPQWREAKASYDQAVEAYEKIRNRITERQRRKYKKQDREADQAALARAERSLQEAKKSLDAVPAFVEEEDIRPYEFSRRHHTRTGVIHLTYRWINTETGVLETQGRLEAKDEAQDVEISGVHPSDQNGHRNKSASLPDAASLRGRVLRKIQAQLVEKVLEDLEGFVRRNLTRAQQEAERGNQETAGEYFVRYLFNSRPDDDRRKEALDFLEAQFHLITLRTWLPGTLPGY